MLFIKPVPIRHRQPELIDQPDLDARRHNDALRGLERINWWSGSTRLLWPALRAAAQRHGSRPLHVLDIATGAGDIPIRLGRKARQAGLDVRLAGCDRSLHAIAYARQRAAEEEIEVRFFEWDALQGDFPGEYDFVLSSLFLHHLDEGQAVELLRQMARAARQGILVHDLMRSPAGYALAYLGTRVLCASPVVHTDGPRSVESAFTPAEVRALARAAGLLEAVVTRRWPCRLLLTWQRAV
jgi:2-polyprenyl-3-methyl-5-hydroxy-6-metoxy-1,4-benzoquinol methylase